MKKILFLVLFSIMSISSYAQSGCSIGTITQLTHNNDGVYSVPAETGYNYFWSVTGNMNIVSGQGTNSITVGTSVSSTVTVSGSIYITKYKEGVAPCCNETSINIPGSSGGTSCGVEVSSVEELNVFGNENVMFHSPITLQLGWAYVSSVFTVTYDNGQVITYTGALNFLNNPQITIPVNDCTNGGAVINVCVTVTANNPSGRAYSNQKVPAPVGNTCSDTKCRDFFIVCGTSGLNKLKNPVKNQLRLELNGLKQAEVLIYDYSGNLKKRAKITDAQSVDVSDLKNGLYIVKLSSKDGLVETKKIQIQR
ncbi:MAG: hypothetical protein COA88_01680 [Kordia sp.]|nr:MAG: hypothetical protein COA88_01680 [Kordia sp.]